MTRPEPSAPNPDRDAELRHLRRAHRWSMATVIWATVASAVAIVAGLAAGSLLLVAFGAIGVLDAIGSVVLVLHFRHALHREAISEHHERLALFTIAIGMATVAVATAGESASRLLEHATTHRSPVGLAVAACSVVALAVLARGKHRIGNRVESRALIADSHVSTVGALLALLTVGGTAATSALGWWWLDPAASVGVALIAVTVAAGHARSAQTG